MSGRGARSTTGPDARPTPAPARRPVARPRVPRSLAVVRRAAGHRPPAPPIIRVAPRSAVAPTPTTGQAAAIPALTVVGPDEHITQPQPRRLSTLRRRLAALAAAGLVVAATALAAGGTRVVLATFTDETAVAATFTTGTWGGTTWYLHDDPSPPAGDTTAGDPLAMDATTPTGATLYNYDTDCDARPGRSIDRGTGQVNEDAACRFATWRSEPLAAPRTLDGTATLVVYARKQFSGGPNPRLVAFLRIVDPAGPMWTELGGASLAVNTNPKQAWSHRTFTWTLAGVTVPAGAQVEVKIVATGGTPNLEIAYDTTGQPSSLTLP